MRSPLIIILALGIGGNASSLFSATSETITEVRDLSPDGRITGMFQRRDDSRGYFTWKNGESVDLNPSRRLLFNVRKMFRDGSITGDSGLNGYPYLWKDGTFTIIAYPKVLDGYTLSSAAITDVSATGRIVGTYSGWKGAKERVGCFTWTGGAFVDLGPQEDIVKTTSGGNVLIVRVRDFFYETLAWINGTFYSITSPSGGSVYGKDIDDSGRVVGRYYDYASSKTRAFLWSSGNTIDISGLDPTEESRPLAISNSGVVTCVAGWRGPAMGNEMGAWAYLYTWKDGVRNEFRPPSGMDRLIPVQVNAEGDVAGWFQPPGEIFENKHAFLFTKGSYLDITPATSGELRISSLSESAVALGSVDFRIPFVAEAGMVFEIRPPDSVQTNLWPTRSQSGRLAGFYYTGFYYVGYQPVGIRRAYTWAGGNLTLLPQGIQPATSSAIMNDSGLIATWYQNVANPSSTKADGAFAWKDGVQTSLFPDGASGGSIRAINNAGIILGSYLDASQTERAFVWKDGVLTAPAPVEATSTKALSLLNEAGQFVGTFTTNTTPHQQYFLGGTNGVAMIIEPPAFGPAPSEPQNPPDEDLTSGPPTPSEPQHPPNEDLTPGAPAVIRLSSKPPRRTTHHILKLRGTTNGEAFYRTKRSRWHSAGEGRIWNFQIRLNPGRNVILLKAQNDNSHSEIEQIVIVRT